LGSFYPDAWKLTARTLTADLNVELGFENNCEFQEYCRPQNVVPLDKHSIINRWTNRKIICSLAFLPEIK
jgi:hypothetical protein